VVVRLTLLPDATAEALAARLIVGVAFITMIVWGALLLAA
jgi:hypothetical protein